MATPYEDIYNSFLASVTSYNLNEMLVADKEASLLTYLNKTCAKFYSLCKDYDLTDKDDITEEFTDDLEIDVIEIISTGMIVEWLRPYFYNDTLLKNFLNTNDYKLSSSPANMLNAVRDTYKEAKKEYTGMANRYSFKSGFRAGDFDVD